MYIIILHIIPTHELAYFLELFIVSVALSYFRHRSPINQLASQRLTAPGRTENMAPKS